MHARANSLPCSCVSAFASATALLGPVYKWIRIVNVIAKLHPSPLSQVGHPIFFPPHFFRHQTKFSAFPRRCDPDYRGITPQFPPDLRSDNGLHCPISDRGGIVLWTRDNRDHNASEPRTVWLSAWTNIPAHKWAHHPCFSPSPPVDYSAPCFPPSHLVDDPARSRLFWWHRVLVLPSTSCVSTTCPSPRQLYHDCNYRERVDCLVHVTYFQGSINLSISRPEEIQWFCYVAGSTGSLSS